MFVLLVLACSEEPSAPPPKSAPPPPPKIQVDPRQVTRVLAPSPREMEAAVKAAGIAEALGPLIPARNYRMDIADHNVVAVRTGVLLADALLTPTTSPKDVFVARLTLIRDGMKTIGMGQGLVASMEEMITRVQNDAASREEFLGEVDAVAAQMIPEEGWGPNDKSGPLVQAGAWLEGANLVSAAIVGANRPEAAEQLMRQKEVPEYFLRYVTEQAPPGADQAVLDALRGALTELRDLGSKPSLTVADVQRVRDNCEKLLALL